MRIQIFTFRDMDKELKPNVESPSSRAPLSPVLLTFCKHCSNTVTVSRSQDKHGRAVLKENRNFIPDQVISDHLVIMPQ